MQSARQLRKLEIEYVPRIKKIFERQLKELISRAEIVGYPEAIRSMNMFTEELTDMLMKMYKKAGMLFGVQVNRILAQELKKDVFFNAELLQRLINILGYQAMRLVTYMDETTKAELLKIVQDGVAAQLSFTQIADQILASNIAGFARALTIARTEINRAANIGAMEAAKMNAFETEKFWIAGKDKLTRTFGKKDEYDHWVLDGKTIDLNDKFEQLGRTNGITVYADQPGDPNCSDNRQASAAFTINCRCTVGFRAKRDARGRLIRKVIPG